VNFQNVSLWPSSHMTYSCCCAQLFRVQVPQMLQILQIPYIQFYYFHDIIHVLLIYRMNTDNKKPHGWKCMIVGNTVRSLTTQISYMITTLPVFFEWFYTTRQLLLSITFEIYQQQKITWQVIHHFHNLHNFLSSV
jgi:hypothetical protein